MARMRKGKSEPLVQSNNIYSCGPHRPEEFYSQASRFEAGYRSILQENVRARAEQKEQEHAMRHGALPSYNSKVWEVRARYQKEMTLPGQANRDKCCDDIC